MGIRNNNSNRNSSSIIVLMLAGGVLLGLTAFFLKIAMGDVTLDANFFLTIITNPYIYVAGVVGLSGFFLFQKALYSGKVSIVSPTITGLAIIIPIILAFLFLSEVISMIKGIGIVLILLGIVGLRE